MKDSLAAFFRHLSLEKDASPHTLRSYRTDLREFSQYAGDGDPAVWLGGVDTRTIRGYLAHLHARDTSLAVVSRATLAKIQNLIYDGRLTAYFELPMVARHTDQVTAVFVDGHASLFRFIDWGLMQWCKDYSPNPASPAPW